MLSYINKKWSLARRVTIVAVLGIVPCIPLLYGVVASDLADIATARQELGGLTEQKKIWANQMTGSAAGASAAIELKSIATAYPHDSKIAATIEQLATAQTAEFRAKHAATLMEDVATASTLILDPEAATYYMMDILSLRLPQLRWKLVEAEAALRTNGASDPIAPEALFALAISAHKIDGIMTAADRLKLDNEPAWRTIGSQIQVLAGFSRWHSGIQSGSKLDPNVVRTQLKTASEGVERAWQSGSTELGRLLLDRIDRKWWHAASMSGMVLALSLTAVAVAILIARAIARTLTGQIDALDRLSRDDDTVKVDCVECRNESRLIYDSLARLKANLVERRRLAEDTLRQAAEKDALNAHYAKEHEAFMTAFRKAADRLAAGDFGYRISEAVIDEYREIVEVMNATMKQLHDVQAKIKTADQTRDLAIAAVGEALSKIADGDLTARIDVGSESEFARLASDFNSALEQLERTIGEVKSSSNNIKVGVDEISVASDDLSRRTESQAATLEQTSAAVAEIATAVSKSSDGAVQASQVVANTKAEAERSGVVVGNAIQAMSAIERSSQEISQIIGVIDEIAFQTNLLALNAGVEAARAGEAGRGFAVVASEVRALAQRSAEAAKQIKGLISSSSKEVAVGVELVGETGKALKQIVEQVTAVSVAVADIAASAKNQSSGLAQVNVAVSQMDQVTQQNAAMVEEATAATRGLQQQTENLNAMIERFKTSNSGHVAMRPAEINRAKAPRISVVQKPRDNFAKGKASKLKSVALSPATNGAAVANGGWEEF